MTNELEAQNRVLRQSVPGRHKGATSAVGAVQNYIGEMEQKLASFGWDALHNEPAPRQARWDEAVAWADPGDLEDATDTFIVASCTKRQLPHGDKLRFKVPLYNHPAPAVGLSEPESIGKIRSALEPRGRFKPTPGEWVADAHEGWAHPMTEVRTLETRDEGGHSIVRVRADFSCTVGKAEYEWANAAFVAACSPKNIRELLAYVDKLHAAITQSMDGSHE